MNVGANQVAQQVSARALQFIQRYYECLDHPNRRGEWINFFVPPGVVQHPVLIWNGHMLPTQNEIAQYLDNLPPTKHSTSSIDAQPMMGSADDFIITVQGTVTYNGNERKRFFHRITTTKAPNSNATYVSSDFFRWTGDA